MRRFCIMGEFEEMNGEIIRKRNSGKNGCWYAAAAGMSGLFLLVFSYFTSPLCAAEGYDATFFRMVGMGMTKGLLPYRDFYDMKGPYLFLIEYLGQRIFYGRLGIFLYQVVSLWIVVILTDKIVWYFTDQRKLIHRILIQIPFLLFLMDTFEGGNMTEEISLPVIMFCMYLGMRYFFGETGEEHPPLWAAVYGASIGFITLIRITNAVTICTVVAAILAELLIRKRFRNIFWNAMAFICGFAAAVIPAAAWCMAEGIFGDMLNQVFLFGFRYAAEGGIMTPFFVTWDCAVYLPLLLFPFAAAFFARREELLRYFLIFHTATLFFVLSMGNHYPHYFVLLLPHVACGAAMLVRSGCSGNENRWRKVVIWISLISVVPSIYNDAYRAVPMMNRFRYHAEEYEAHYRDGDAVDLAARIPKEDSDSVFAYGFYSEWYIHTGLFPCIRYCDWQNHYVELSGEVAEDLKRILWEESPKWVVTSFETEPSNPPFVTEVLQKKYVETYSNETYRLWHLEV